MDLQQAYDNNRINILMKNTVITNQIAPFTIGDSKQTLAFVPGVINAEYRNYPGIQFRLPCIPPGQFFMGAKLFIGTPWMGNKGVLKKNLVWAM